MTDPSVVIRPAREDELVALGALVADAYASLPGMPGPDVFPDYYADLRDAEGRAAIDAFEQWVAAGPDGSLLGGVVVVTDMSVYGPDVVGADSDAIGIRMLAIRATARGRGLGRRLTEHGVERARSLRRPEVILHTTDPMRTARGLYERMGFRADPSLDFEPGGGFVVRGFRLSLGG